MVSADQAWSVDTAGERQRIKDERGDAAKGRTSSRDLSSTLAKYPVVGMVQTSDGDSFSLYPAVLKMKTDAISGSVLHSDGYQIEVKRLIKAGEPVSVLVVGDAILSIETALGVLQAEDETPAFAAFKDGMKPGARASAVEAWRTANRRFAE